MGYVDSDANVDNAIGDLGAEALIVASKENGTLIALYLRRMSSHLALWTVQMSRSGALTLGQIMLSAPATCRHLLEH
jgi:hypothetical protein